MRILQIINSLDTGGAEKLLLETIPLYAKQGIKMDLLILKGKDSPFLKELKNKNCCEIINLNLKNVYNPISIFKLIPYLKIYNIIHVHLFPSLYWVVFAKIFSRKRTPIIYTEHNTNNRRRSSRIFKIIDRIIYKHLEKIVTISKTVDNNLKQHLNSSSNNIILIENGVNLSNIENAKPYKKNKFFKDSDVLLIQVSSFTFQKEQNTLIKALALLSDKYKLLLVGDGFEIQNSKDLVVKLNLKNRVKFLGIRMDVPKLLKTTDIVVLSSKYEGLSLSSVEGLASGKPFVASDVSGLTDVVQGAGLLFEQGNHKELASKIKNLIEDKELYNQIANKCLERSKEYDINKMVDKHIMLYNQILNK